MIDEFKKSPFGDHENWKLNACVGENGGPYGYSDYAAGYFLNGHILSEHLVRESGLLIDILIYPLLYSYRHALELSIKHILESNGVEVLHIHNLEILWKKAEPIISSLTGFNAVTELSRIIKDFCLIDPVAEVPRFPKNKKGDLFMQDMRIINIIPIHERMKHAESLLQEIYAAMDCACDNL